MSVPFVNKSSPFIVTDSRGHIRNYERTMQDVKLNITDSRGHIRNYERTMQHVRALIGRREGWICSSPNECSYSMMSIPFKMIVPFDMG